MTRGLVMSVALALPVSLAGCGSAPPTDKSGTATPMNKLGTAAPTNQSDDGTEPAPKSRFADVPIPEEPAVEFVVLDPALATSKAAEIPTQELSEMDGKVVDEVVALAVTGGPGEASKRLNALAKEYGKPEDAARLMQVYLAIGKKLEKQWSETPADKKAERTALLTAFDELAALITKGKYSFAGLVWLIEAHQRLGEGSEARGEPTAESKACFAKAHEVIRRVLAEMEKDADFGPRHPDRDKWTMHLQVQQLPSLGRGGNADRAVALFPRIHSEYPTLLDAQREGAMTLERAGAQTPAKYRLAIEGDLETTNRRTKAPEKQIWGWLRLSDRLEKSAAKDKSLLPHFHDARYHLNHCRYRLALAEKDAKAKKDGLEAVEADLRSVAVRHPDLGGEASAQRYEGLFQDALKANGKQGKLR